MLRHLVIAMLVVVSSGLWVLATPEGNQRRFMEACSSLNPKRVEELQGRVKKLSADGLPKSKILKTLRKWCKQVGLYKDYDPCLVAIVNMELASRDRATKLPGYEVVLDDSSDTPIKTQVELRITLDKRPSESELRALLRSLYEKAKRRSGFKFRAHPNAVYIYAFAKKNYHKNSGASWIGMLSYVPDDKEPRISVESSSLKAQFEESSTRFGLTEKQRKRVYWKLFEIEDKAQREAERKVPNPKTLEDFKRQAGEFNKLHARYLKRLLRKYKITDEQRVRVQITLEGMQKNWQYPSP